MYIYVVISHKICENIVYSQVMYTVGGAYMKELQNDIKDLISLLDKITERLIENEYDITDYLPKMSELMIQVFPQIIRTYMLPEFSEVAEDAKYWSNQLANIMDAIQGKDVYKQLDVLYFETKENLELYVQMIEGMEFSL